MNNAVFLNVERLNFDHKLDFSSIDKLTKLTQYEASNDDNILSRVQGQNIVITKELPVGRDLISQFPPSVKIICEAGTGYNNIDIEAAKEKNIIVCNVPGYSTQAVAQLVMTLILNFCCSLTLQQLMIKRGNFDNFTKDILLPHFEVQEKTLGIICSGSIGRQVIEHALNFGMKVLVYNRTPRQWNNPNIKNVSLEELLRQSDFISLHCPLTPDTKYLINKDTLKLMKPTAYIINTSRGQIIKEADLIEALQNKQLAGAALDVQEQEPPALDNPLFTMDNVIMTPHIGWKTLESRQRLIELLAMNIEAYLKGKPINVIG
ncbi:NAD(P)-dependent oxidoreductase [Desulforamulus ferrireducens]|uniref:Hydroxyacid dehydrogenase n=1 Tax=Desulforamulus ferrireducens TaxID=1833852 RepID=A0A1S6IWM7_9FIRM|nr:NAD(P)-dependent oxidoreductase [Desulforamulus ferrireducens]AQS59182.1 hydroxyacid dehydrogenase [Desulforamulus ferrireducens]